MAPTFEDLFFPSLHFLLNLSESRCKKETDVKRLLPLILHLLVPSRWPAEEVRKTLSIQLHKRSQLNMHWVVIVFQEPFYAGNTLVLKEKKEKTLPSWSLHFSGKSEAINK